MLPTVFLHGWVFKTSLLENEGAVAQYHNSSTLSKIQHKFLNELETGPEAVKCPTLKGNYSNTHHLIFIQMAIIWETPTLPRNPMHLVLLRIRRQELKSSSATAVALSLSGSRRHPASLLIRHTALKHLAATFAAVFTVLFQKVTYNEAGLLL